MQEILCSQFTLSVCCVWNGSVFIGNLAVRHLLTGRTKDTEAAEIDELLHRHLQRQQSVYEMFRPLCVHTEEIVSVETFRHTGSMHHIVKLMWRECCAQLFLAVKVKFYEVYALIADILPRTSASNSSPHLHATVQCLFNYETPDESRGTSNKNFHACKVTIK